MDEHVPRSKSRVGYTTGPQKCPGERLLFSAATEDDTTVASSNRTAQTQIPYPQESFKRDPNQYLPMANIIRIMRRTLPPHAKIADDAKETIQECVSEFIDHITRHANAICHRDRRKTVSPEDVVFAMDAASFRSYAEALALFLRKYREDDLDRSFMNNGRAFVGPNSPPGGSVQAQQGVDLDRRLTDGFMFSGPNFGEGSSSGGSGMNAVFDFPFGEFDDVYRQFE